MPRNPAVSSFPTEYLLLWKKAATMDTPLRVLLPRNKALHLRHQLYKLRKALRREHNVLVEVVDRLELIMEETTQKDILELIFRSKSLNDLSILIRDQIDFEGIEEEEIPINENSFISEMPVEELTPAEVPEDIFDNVFDLDDDDDDDDDETDNPTT